ncbi:hypothetical protein F8S09_09750 [Deinococcus sp. SDU3-2]|uniref:Aminoglycoside phosphotransferase domain-containing protein n=1 Tax=Deinococcus terrestris TaxID=2651870 RepID=A0A7X1TS12_9DEIO|nr:hypothetical protein [Deinococcus terrestris]MPY66969.1 hypothetical protein [Deinococcus terrestris]
MLQAALEWAAGVLAPKGLHVSGHDVWVARPDRSVALLHTAQGRRYVLKADAQAGGLTLEAEHARLLHGLGFPVALPGAHRAGPPSLLLRAFQEGRGLDASATPEQRQAVGRLLRALHDTGGGRSPPGEQSWAAWMLGWLQGVWHFWQAQLPAARHREAQLAEWFHRLEPLLAERGGHLILMDGRPEHFLIAGDRLELIDVAEVRAGDAWMDLAVIWLWEREVYPQVLAGYSPGVPERAVGERLLPFYAFLRALSAAEWCTDHGPAHLVAGFLREAEHLLDSQGNV